MTSLRPEPCYFGPSDRPLFGWLHAAQKPAASVAPPSNIGLIICNPFGHEAICAHRSIKHLAGAAAAAGFATLRFDYDGTGNSAGDDLDLDRVDAWVTSIEHGIDTLKAETGVDRVCLLGIRLGATLGMLAAARRTDVAALIAVAPVVNAKAYVRELRALQMAMQSDEASETADDGVLESAGFVLSAGTQERLKSIDLRSADLKPPPYALILDRDDLAGNEAWALKLGQGGAVTHRQSVPGYVEMMLDPHRSIVPQEIINTAVDWLGNQFGKSPVAVAAAATATATAAATATAPHSAAARLGPLPRSMRIALPSVPPLEETAVFFGANATTFGILTTPTVSSAPAGGLPVSGTKTPVKSIVLVNAGAVYHVGPNRLHVSLARRWAALGHTVLRFDLSGIGDSSTAPGAAENVVYSDRAMADLRDALEFLAASRPAMECHAVGLCSGAYHAFKAAAGKLPLSGIILINPLTFSWKEGMSLDYPAHLVASSMLRYKTTAFRTSSWLKLLRGDVSIGGVSQILLHHAQSMLLAQVRNVARRLRLPLKNDLGTELARIASGSVDMLFVFAPQDPGLEILRIQGGSALRRLRSKRQLDIEIVAGADHTFTSRAARERLVAVLGKRLDGPVPCRSV